MITASACAELSLTPQSLAESSGFILTARVTTWFLLHVLVSASSRRFPSSAGAQSCSWDLHLRFGAWFSSRSWGDTFPSAPKMDCLVIDNPKWRLCWRCCLLPADSSFLFCSVAGVCSWKLVSLSLESERVVCSRSTSWQIAWNWM